MDTISSCCIFMIFTILHSCVTSQFLTKCESEVPILFFQPDQKGLMNGYIDAELESNRMNGMVFVKKISFNGFYHLQGEPRVNLSITFDIIKSIRIQHILEFKYQPNETLKESCNLGFIENIDSEMPVPDFVQTAILEIAEICIEKTLCNLDPSKHRIGDQFHVKPRSNKISSPTSSEDIVNVGIDFIMKKLIDDLVRANLSVFEMSNFSTSFYGMHFSSSGGPIDILPYVKRIEDFSFYYEGYRYTLGSAFNSTGGIVQFNDVKLSSLFNTLSGVIPINITGTTLRLTIEIDYSVSPCKISVKQITLNAPQEAVDFTQLVSNGFFSGNAEKILSHLHGGKLYLVNYLAEQVENLLKDFIEGFDCEGYRSTIFMR